MRDTAKGFPRFDAPSEVTTLRAWHCRYRTFDPIAQLENLKGLVVATYPDPTFDPLCGLRTLRYLSVLHAPKVQTLDPLAALANLEVLSIASLPSWDASGRVIEVDSLRPLAGLAKLRHVELFGVRPSDGSLRDLEGCPALQSVRVSKYPSAEVERFRSARRVTDAFAPKPWF